MTANVDVRAPKQKVCKSCSTSYTPRRALQSVCSLKCSLDLSRAKVAEKARKDAQKAHRERKAELKPKAYYVKQAQSAFNAWVRYRDRDLPCISCGRHHDGQYHAGHYRTTASQPALRFNEINCHKQCAPCNNNLSGDIIRYRQSLITRIGQELVDWLETDHPRTTPWTVEELKAIKRYYVKAKKDMEKLMEAGGHELSSYQ